MRATWPVFYASLAGSLNRRSSETTFRALRAVRPALANFAGPSELLHFQSQPQGDPAFRYEVIRALGEASQLDPVVRTLATTLTILALWPALDAAHARLWRGFPNDRAELAADLIARITQAVLTLDLSRVEKVASTLVRNVERDLRRQLISGRERAQQETQMDDDVVAEVGQRYGDGAAAAVRGDIAIECLGIVSAADRDLLCRVIQMGETQKEAGKVLGLTHAAARKRYQRAIASLRKECLQKMSHSKLEIGLSLLTDRKGRSGMEIGS